MKDFLLRKLPLQSQTVQLCKYLCLHVPEFQRQVFKDMLKLYRVKQKKKKGSVLVAELVYNSQNVQFARIERPWVLIDNIGFPRQK